MLSYDARNYTAGFSAACDHIARDLLSEDKVIDTGHWQALKDVPQTKTLELRNVIIEYQIPPNQPDLADDIWPNLPWAESHFQERVGGEPTNPGKEYLNWPHWRGGHMPDGERFSHTYMERFWPRFAGSMPSRISPDATRAGIPGIRYRYGDLNDVLDLLAREPYTRQAYLPVWFPEDTGAHHGERVPCTLGYHFLLREGKLHCTYPIRSCDFLRHFRDDVYMAARLVQWVIGQVKPRGEVDDEKHQVWGHVVPGTLTFHAMSLHVFEGDLPMLRRMASA